MKLTGRTLKMLRPAALAILVGGGIAGTLDILCAITLSRLYGNTPKELLQLIASGLLGRPAFSGGLASAALGICLHFLLSFSFAAAFYASSKRYRTLLLHPLISGVVYGLVVFGIMNFVALPLSAYPYPFRLSFPSTGIVLLAHMLLFGIPIALAARTARRRISNVRPIEGVQ
jgi:uncharacterized membrane protein YagU involved in acid resistance